MEIFKSISDGYCRQAKLIDSPENYLVDKYLHKNATNPMEKVVQTIASISLSPSHLVIAANCAWVTPWTVLPCVLSSTLLTKNVQLDILKQCT